MSNKNRKKKLNGCNQRMYNKRDAKDTRKTVKIPFFSKYSGCWNKENRKKIVQRKSKHKHKLNRETELYWMHHRVGVICYTCFTHPPFQLNRIIYFIQYVSTAVLRDVRNVMYRESLVYTATQLWRLNIWKHTTVSSLQLRILNTSWITIIFL